MSARIMAQTSYKETGAREVQIPKETLPSPSPTSSFGALFSKLLKMGDCRKNKTPTPRQARRLKRGKTRMVKRFSFGFTFTAPSVRYLFCVL